MSAASSPISSPPTNEKELDVENAKRGVWLVKVPKYLAKEWEKVDSMTDVGKLKIEKPKDAKAQPAITFSVSDQILNRTKKDKTGGRPIPTEHKFQVSNVTHQHLAVFSVSIDASKSKRPKLEGQVVQRGECQPVWEDKKYMILKRESLRTAAEPKSKVEIVEKTPVPYKPISAHKLLDSQAELKKKSEGKKARDDKDRVTNVLFNAFEKHQYYALKDLAKITNQPIPYLKEILNEFCVYNNRNPHKNTWELKPEYRHYSKPE